MDRTIWGSEYFAKKVTTKRPHLGETTITNQLDLVSRFFPIKQGQGKLSLDVGCGVGYAIRVLMRYGYEAYGTDVSEYAVTRARMLIGQHENVEVADATDSIPFEREFDLITCFEVIEHVRFPRTLLFNCYSKLKHGGLLVMSTPNRLSPMSFLRGDPTHVNVHSTSYWKSLADQLPGARTKFFVRQWLPLTWKSEGRFRFFNLPLVGSCILFTAVRE